MVALGGVSAASAGDGLNVSGTALAPDQIGYSKNIKHMSNTPLAGTFALPGAFGTDLAFQGDRAYVGNYNGFAIYDISEAGAPEVIAQVNCPGSQNDISVRGDLVYLSTDSSRTDDSCASTSGPTTVKSSWEGMKIFDISDETNPKYIKSVETKCGSHTHTVVPGADADYLYVSSYGPSGTAVDCQRPHDLISIVKVPHGNPTAASVIAEPVLFPEGGNTNTSGCHDITAFPSKKIAAGACMGDGVIMDISNPEAPKVIETVRDTNFAFWHSATFNSDGTKVVFTDELGGGAGATCNARSAPTACANAIYDLSAGNELTFKSYFKIARHQNSTENCVAHNGSIIPVNGRDVMVQSWYQGGTSLWEFTDSDQPEGARLLRARPAVPDLPRWHVVVVLLQRVRLQLGHHQGPGRPHAQGPDAAQGQLGPPGRVQRPDPAGLPHQARQVTSA